MGKNRACSKIFLQLCGFAINPASKFIHLSYSDDLARDNSREIQNIVTNESFQTLLMLN